MPDFEVAIVGGGVVGLGIAARLSHGVDSVALFERHETWGREISSRNSEVVHSGIYYPRGSLKAKLCVAGRHRLYEFCRAHRVEHRVCGKIVVATCREEVRALEDLERRGKENGVEDLRMLTADEVRALEPNVRSVAGLHVPCTGILSAHGLMDAYAHEAREAGVILATGAEVCGLVPAGDGWTVRYRDSSGETTITTRMVVNAAGLGAQAVMRMAGLDPEAMNLKLHMAKGDYFAVNGPKRNMIARLVYPTPEAHLVGLGIHTVVGMGGGFKLGPSACYVDKIDYAVDDTQRRAFFESARKFLPFLEEEDLTPDMAGIRPKLAGPGEAARDFHIAHEPASPGFINLCGIESPGLTASLAIGDCVAEMAVAYLG